MKTYVTEREGVLQKGLRNFVIQDIPLLTKRPHRFNLSNETQMKFAVSVNSLLDDWNEYRVVKV